MIDANTFHRSIQEISILSEQLGDGWVLHDDNVDEKAFLSKKAKIKITSQIFTFEYHILFSDTYSVPILLFNISRNDGMLLTNIEDCQRLFNINKIEESYIFMQQEHPHLHEPFLAFHPCKTSEIMETFIKQTKNPVVSWISVIGPHVYLNIPIAYSQLT